MSIPLKIPPAVDADNPRYWEVGLSGDYLEIQSATKPFKVRLRGPKFDKIVPAKEGTRIWVPDGLGVFTLLSFINPDVDDTLRVSYEVGGGKNQLRVENNTGNRVPPTRLKASEAILANAASLEFEGVDNNQRRKLIQITNFTANSRLLIRNDATSFTGVGCLDANAPGVWQGETDGNITILNQSGGDITYGVAEYFYID